MSNFGIEIRDIIKCPKCGSLEFIAKVTCDISVKFYLDNGLLYPKTDIFDINDDTITDIECANCEYTLASTIKDLNTFIQLYNYYKNTTS